MPGDGGQRAFHTIHQSPIFRQISNVPTRYPTTRTKHLHVAYNKYGVTTISHNRLYTSSHHKPRQPHESRGEKNSHIPNEYSVTINPHTPVRTRHHHDPHPLGLPRHDQTHPRMTPIRKDRSAHDSRYLECHCST